MKKRLERFYQSYNDLKSIYLKKLSRDWRFNTFQWAQAIFNLTEKILFSYLRMKALSIAYKNVVSSGSHPNHTNPGISFYADTTVINLNSLRDKLALMAWAYHHPFNPEKQEEVLDFNEIFNRLKKSESETQGASLNHSDFLTILQAVHNGYSMFKHIARYRHFKIHRLEPIIHMYGPQLHNTKLPYIRFDETNIQESIDISDKPINGLHVGYDEIEKVIESSLEKIIDTSSELFTHIHNLPPYSNSMV